MFSNISGIFLLTNCFKRRYHDPDGSLNASISVFQSKITLPTGSEIIAHIMIPGRKTLTVNSLVQIKAKVAYILPFRFFMAPISIYTISKEPYHAPLYTSILTVALHGKVISCPVVLYDESYKFSVQTTETINSNTVTWSLQSVNIRQFY